jgi:hypothetical protein
MQIIYSLDSFWQCVVFFNTTWVLELRDSYKINRLNINNWSYTTNALYYWPPDVVYITLGGASRFSRNITFRL